MGDANIGASVAITRVIEQIDAVDDALEDWRDIVPEDVEELCAKLVALRTMENRG